jgi:hypothetical protein
VSENASRQQQMDRRETDRDIIIKRRKEGRKEGSKERRKHEHRTEYVQPRVA